MKEFWGEWFGRGRGVGNPTRAHIKTPEAFTRWIQENEGRGICSYASVQPFEAYEAPYCIEKLFFDFDCKEDPEKAGDEARLFTKRLRKFYEVEPLLVFSGNKGYHLYLFLQTPFGLGVEKRNLRSIYMKLQKMLVGKARYETLDSSVLGDISQLARIPYTHHEKTGVLCQPLHEGQPLEYTPGLMDHYRRLGLSFEFCKRVLYKLAEDLKAEERRRRAPRAGRCNYSSSLRPCIERSLESQIRGEGGHKMRVGVVAELNANGWGVNRIVDAFSSIPDFNQRKTEYYVKDIVRKGYKPFKCTTISSLGFCIDSECPIYRRKTGGQFHGRGFNRKKDSGSTHEHKEREAIGMRALQAIWDTKLRARAL